MVFIVDLLPCNARAFRHLLTVDALIDVRIKPRRITT